MNWNPTINTGSATGRPPSENSSERSSSPPDKAPLAVYVHWPFCTRKCPYCDFNSHVRQSVDQEAYRRAYRREIAAFRHLTGERRVNSIFFGGGTPSLMSAQTVAGILDDIAANWTLTSDCEVTLEANPSSAEADRFAAYRRAGVNRLSQGLQSLNDDALKFLGRLHSAAEARRALEAAKTCFPRVTFDMIYALPGQSARDWREELSNALTLADGHMSLYQLTLEEGTPFHTQARRGRLSLPDEADALDLYDMTQELTSAAGLEAYEISNHARPGQEARHNLHVWRGGEYIGIGPGAHGRLKSPGAGWVESARPKKPEAWLLKATESGVGEGIALLTSAERARELLLLGLRLTDGVDTNNIAANAGLESGQVISPEACERLQASGHLVAAGGCLRLTKKGRAVLNAVVAAVAA